MADDLLITFGSDLSKVRAELSAFRTEVEQNPIRIIAGNIGGTTPSASIAPALSSPASATIVSPGNVSGVTPPSAAATAATIAAVATAQLTASRVPGNASGVTPPSSGAIQPVWFDQRGRLINNADSGYELNESAASLRRMGARQGYGSFDSRGRFGGESRPPQFAEDEVVGSFAVASSPSGGRRGRGGYGGGDGGVSIADEEESAGPSAGILAMRRQLRFIRTAMFALGGAEGIHALRAQSLGSVQAQYAFTPDEQINAQMSVADAASSGLYGQATGLVSDIGDKIFGTSVGQQATKERLIEQRAANTASIRSTDAFLRGQSTRRLIGSGLSGSVARRTQAISEEETTTNNALSRESTDASAIQDDATRKKLMDSIRDRRDVAKTVADDQREQLNYGIYRSEYGAGIDLQQSQASYALKSNLSSVLGIYGRGQLDYMRAQREGSPLEADLVRQKNAYDLAGFGRNLLASGSAVATENPLAIDIGQAGVGGQKSSVIGNDDAETLKLIYQLLQGMSGDTKLISDAI